MPAPHDDIEPDINIRSLWPALDPATRQWLMDHTGYTTVPQAITARVCEVADQPLPRDSHGQLQLSEDDIVFIRNHTHSHYAAHGSDKFFEAVQPKTANQTQPPHHPGFPHQT